jgi:uncharacterized protein YaeQ
MALKATIFKAQLQITDLDRQYYQTHSLTLARHPSETDERMMVRLLAFVLNAHDDLQFTRGLSTEDEPDLWQKSLTGEIDVWIEVGMPDEKSMRKPCHRAGRVVVYSYGGSRCDIWWAQLKGRLDRLDNLTVVNLLKAQTDALARLAARTLDLQCTIQEGTVWMSTPDAQVVIEPTVWREATR